MERNDIIKALECCASYDRDASCGECPYMYAELADNEICSNRMATDALSLIKELTEENDELLDTIACLEIDLGNAKRSTIHKMHSEIEKRCIKGGIYPAFVKSTIDQIAKEIIGEGND